MKKTLLFLFIVLLSLPIALAEQYGDCDYGDGQYGIGLCDSGGGGGGGGGSGSQSRSTSVATTGGSSTLYQSPDFADGSNVVVDFTTSYSVSGAVTVTHFPDVNTVPSNVRGAVFAIDNVHAIYRVYGSSQLEDAMSEATITFKVPADNIDLDSYDIGIVHVNDDGTTESLTPESVTMEGEFVVVTASLPGFSYFVITKSPKVAAQPAAPVVSGPEVTEEAAEPAGTQEAEKPNRLGLILIILAVIVILVIGYVVFRRQRDKF